MKKWLCVGVVSMIFMVGTAFAGEYTVQKKAGDYTVDIRMDKNPPVVGANQVEVAVKDKAGKAVTDADTIGQIIVVAGLIGQVVPFMKSGAVAGVIDYVQYDGSYRAAEMLFKLAKAGKAGWTKVLQSYKKDYPANKLELQGFGWVTATKVNMQKWPEIGWIMTLDDHQKKYPKVWALLK